MSYTPYKAFFLGYNELGTEVHVTESQVIAFGVNDKLLCCTVRLFVLLVRSLMETGEKCIITLLAIFKANLEL